jgi:cell division protein FtsX
VREASTPRATLRLRLTWAVRLTAFDVRRHRGGVALGLVAFAVAVAAATGSAAAYTAWRAKARTADRQAGAELVAFLRDDISEPSRRGLADALRGVPGVAAVRLLTSDEALARMRADLGERATLLDGVEEGFLPTTLEVALQPGPRGVERADAIAWRLRRMEGIGEVDVLQTADDQRLARADVVNRLLARRVVVAGVVVVVLALVVAAWALRRRPADSLVLTELGFTGASVRGPAAARGVLVGGAGALLGGGAAWAMGGFVSGLTGVAGGAVGAGMAGMLGAGGLTESSALGRAAAVVGLAASSGGAALAAVLSFAVVAAVVGGTFGWWGARASRRDAREWDAFA